MSDKTIIFFLAVVVCLLFLVVLYQRFIFGRGIQAKIKRMNKKLEEILETGSDEKVMVFTDNPVLMELGGQSQYHQLCWWFAITPPGSFVFPPKGGLTNRSFLLLVTA